MSSGEILRQWLSRIEKRGCDLQKFFFLTKWQPFWHSPAMTVAKIPEYYHSLEELTHTDGVFLSLDHEITSEGRFGGPEMGQRNRRREKACQTLAQRSIDWAIFSVISGSIITRNPPISGYLMIKDAGGWYWGVPVSRGGQWNRQSAPRERSHPWTCVETFLHLPDSHFPIWELLTFPLHTSLWGIF